MLYLCDAFTWTQKSTYASPHPPPTPPVLLRLKQVRLTEELASSTARVSQLQLEASAHQQKAAELQNKLNSALQDSESHGQRITALEAQLEGLENSEHVITSGHSLQLIFHESLL